MIGRGTFRFSLGSTNCPDAHSFVTVGISLFLASVNILYRVSSVTKMSSRNSERRSFYKGNRNWRSKTAVTEQEPPLGALVREVIVKDLCDEAMALEESSSISNCTTVTSYNWVHAKEPTILVPGRSL